MGKLEVIAGCMFSGKSEELIRRIKRSEIAKQEVIVFKPSIDNRYMEKEVCTHDGLSQKAESVEDVWDIVKKSLPYGVVAIDEVQFFPSEIVAAIDSLVHQGKRVIVSGLDMDFQQDPFHITAMLLAKADKVNKLTAVCMECGKEATKTQRRVEGKPVYEGNKIEVGGSESYVAVCGECY